MIRELYYKYKQRRYGWFGNYSSWKQVCDEADGYDSDIIFEKTKQAILKVKSGEAVYERDSVIFDRKEYNFAIIAFLQYSAIIKKRPLHILDFGGSLGSTYYQLKEFLLPNVCASYNIVEQGHYIQCGKDHFEDHILKFYTTIDECIAEKKIDFVLFAGSVHYLEKPHDFLEEFVKYNFEFVLFDRTYFHRDRGDRITLQKVPPQIYPASYPCWFLDEKSFLKHFSDNYRLFTEYLPFVNEEKDVMIDRKLAGHGKGFFFINRSIDA